MKIGTTGGADLGRVVDLAFDRSPSIYGKHRAAVSAEDLLSQRRFRDVGVADPVPALRLRAWRDLACRSISVEVCRSLWRHGFHSLSVELMRLRGGAA
jgi:hypothetical protein